MFTIQLPSREKSTRLSCSDDFPKEDKFDFFIRDRLNPTNNLCIRTFKPSLSPAYILLVFQNK